MPVRLNKALKELNVGINTVAEFLQKKGKVLEDVSPNAKITDEQYELLMSAFGADKSKHEEIRLDIQKRKEKEQKERDERREQQQKEKAEKKKQSEEPFRTASERKQTLKIVGNINDIQAKKTPAKAKEEVKEETPLPTPPVETPSVAVQKTEPQAETVIEAHAIETPTEKKKSSKKKPVRFLTI